MGEVGRDRELVNASATQEANLVGAVEQTRSLNE